MGYSLFYLILIGWLIKSKRNDLSFLFYRLKKMERKKTITKTIALPLCIF